MSADNGIYILGPCLKDDNCYYVAYAAAIDNIDYPTRDSLSAIGYTRSVFGQNIQYPNSIKNPYDPVKCTSQKQARDVAVLLHESFCDDLYTTEYGIVELGEYPYKIEGTLDRIIVLNDGETYSNIKGCKIFNVPADSTPEEIEEFIKNNPEYGVDICDYLH